MNMYKVYQACVYQLLSDLELVLALVKTLNTIHKVTEPRSDSISMIWLYLSIVSSMCVYTKPTHKDRVRGRATHYTYYLLMRANKGISDT